MNNCDERIEKTLNRAGQTITDLPKGYLLNAGEARDIQGVACRWFIYVCCVIGIAIIESVKPGISDDTRVLAMAILMCGLIARGD